MSTASDQAPLPPSSPAPSVFLSYASEDRTAARTLRDALGAAGLDVWYDENELTGGDSWDQKIRRQIRDCEYFMPVISASTEARKEGYFRREWRLAVERSLDMADDVLFLIPITIDGTPEHGARVPDTFLSVQWLRLPGGHATPALHHLVRRILSGNHHALTRPPMAFNRPPPTGAIMAPFAEPPPLSSVPPGGDPHVGSPPPMPPMPHVPENGGFLHGIKFIFEIMWWALTAVRMLFKRLPKWVRVLVTIWAVITLFSLRTCSFGSGASNNQRRDRDPDPNPKSNSARNPDGADAAKEATKQVMERFGQAAREARKNGNSVDLARLGEQIAKNFGQGVPGSPDGPAMGKKLVLLPFGKLKFDEGDPSEKFASAVFASLYGQLSLTHAREVGLLRAPPGNGGDTALFARSKALGSAFILTGHLSGEKETRALMVRLLVTEDGSVKWSETFPVANSEPSEIADKIADKINEVLPARRGPERPPKPSEK